MIFFSENYLDVCDFYLDVSVCVILYFFLIVCNKPHANPTIIYENIKEIHILDVGGTLEFPILSHVLLRRDYYYIHGVQNFNSFYRIFGVRGLVKKQTVLTKYCMFLSLRGNRSG